MNQSNLNFKVVVSDEIFDFRSLEDANSRRTSTIPIRTRSYNAIDVNHKKDIPLSNERHRGNLEKLAKSMHNQNSYLQQKLKRPKQKTRSKTADPRFRRSRSPIYPKQLSASHSTNMLNKPVATSSQAKSIKPFSASSPTIQTNNICEQPCQEVEAYRGKQKETSTSSPHPCIMTEKDRNLMEGNDSYSKSPEDDEDKFLYSLDYVNEVNIFGTESVDETELSTTRMTQIPYWDDPRLLLNNNLEMKPIRNRAPIPLSTKKSQNSSVLLCRRYGIDLDPHNTFSAYRYDDVTEICSCSLLSDEIDIRKKIYKEGNSFIIPHMLLGSLFGIILVSFIIWLINWNLFENLYKIWKKPVINTNIQDSSYMFNYMKYISTYLLQNLEILYSKIYKLLILQRKDVFNHNDSDDQNYSWW